MKYLGGVNPPAVTIFDENGRIDIEAMQEHAEFLISKGVNGLAYMGTAGEFGVVPMEEKKRLIREMIAYVAGRVNVIVGVGDTCKANTLELMAYAEKEGADGFLMVNPYYSIYSTDMVEAYYKEVASHTSLPIIIYNYPDLTGFSFSADTVCRIVKDAPNVIGIKDTIGDFSHVISMQKVKEINPDFLIFGAFENQALGLFACGINGFINGTANFAPEFTVNTYQAALKNDMNEAAKWYRKMVSAMEMYSYTTPLFLACKQAVYDRILKRNGYECAPGRSLNEEEKAKVHDKLTELELVP